MDTEKNSLSTGGLFQKFQEKTGLNDQKIDLFQKNWLPAVKERTAYKKITDVPLVVGEEGVAIANDTLNALRGRPTGESLVFKKIGSLIADWRGKLKAMARATPAAPATPVAPPAVSSKKKK